MIGYKINGSNAHKFLKTQLLVNILIKIKFKFFLSNKISDKCNKKFIVGFMRRFLRAKIIL